jgi:hypothetical protein
MRQAQAASFGGQEAAARGKSKALPYLAGVELRIHPSPRRFEPSLRPRGPPVRIAANVFVGYTRLGARRRE